MKFLNIFEIFDDYHENMQTIGESISGLNFAIPEEIFIVLDTLTNVVGYFMPLRLYTPIITLILSYWAISIVGYVYRGSLRLFNGLSSFATKFFK